MTDTQVQSQARTRAWRLVLAGLCAMGSGTAGRLDAQTRSDSSLMYLRLGALIDAVQRVNPRIAAASASARSVAARLPGAARLPDPQIQLGLMNYELPGLRQMPGLGMAQLQVMQMVPTPGKLRLAGQLEAARAAAAGERVAEAAFDVRARASMMFYDLYVAGENVSVARETRRTLKDLAAIARQMYEVGDGRQADVLRATVEVARMDEEVIRMETMKSVMQSSINALLLRADSVYVGTPLLPAFPPGVALDSLIETLEFSRPMVRAAVRDVDAAVTAERIAQRDIWPDLQIGIQFGRQSGPMGPQYMGSLMVGASIPIYARSRQYGMRDEARALREMANADLANMRVETRGGVAEATANLLRARRLSELYRGSVLPQAEATVSSSLAAYRAGTVDFMTLLDAQMTLNGFRQALATLHGDEGKAWAVLEMLTGRVLVDPQSPQPPPTRGGIK